MKYLACVFAIGLMCACAQPESQARNTTADIPQTIGCNAQASRDWSAVGSQYYVIEAEAHGPNCADAVATMRIKSRDGAVLFERDYPTAHVPLAFNPNNTQTGLRAELDAWIQNTAIEERASTLPAWPAGASAPPNFQPAVGRGRYEGARGAQGPLFCFPDGAESNACIAMAGDNATLLGSLTPERL